MMRYAAGWMWMMLMMLLVLPACRGTYYGAMEKMGVHKRDILVERVEEARDGQEEAKVQFANALEQFASVVKIEGGKLEEIYKKLNSELERSEARAQAVRDRIKAVERVSADLFKEWEKELEQYSSAALRDASARQLTDTRTRYSQMIAAMKKAEAKMEPVLTIFRDQVLFLKHNLNAQALSSLAAVAAELDTEVNALIADMQSSINEAEAFIAAMPKS